MKKKIDLKHINVSKFFYEYLYPLMAKEFLFMNNYEQFANLVQLHFILTSEQWELVLNEWEFKEMMLSDKQDKPLNQGCPFDELNTYNPSTLIN